MLWSNLAVAASRLGCVHVARRAAGTVCRRFVETKRADTPWAAHPTSTRKLRVAVVDAAVSPISRAACRAMFVAAEVALATRKNSEGGTIRSPRTASRTRNAPSTRRFASTSGNDSCSRRSSRVAPMTRRSRRKPRFGSPTASRPSWRPRPSSRDGGGDRAMFGDARGVGEGANDDHRAVRGESRVRVGVARGVDGRVEDARRRRRVTRRRARPATRRAESDPRGFGTVSPVDTRMARVRIRGARVARRRRGRDGGGGSARARRVENRRGRRRRGIRPR